MPDESKIEKDALSNWLLYIRHQDLTTYNELYVRLYLQFAFYI